MIIRKVMWNKRSDSILHEHLIDTEDTNGTSLTLPAEWITMSPNSPGTEYRGKIDAIHFDPLYNHGEGRVTVDYRTRW